VKRSRNRGEREEGKGLREGIVVSAKELEVRKETG